MKGEGLALRCARDWMSDSVVFELCAYLGDSRHSAAEPVVMKRIEKGAERPPSFALDEVAAQKLFADLWRLGFRPKDGTGNAGHIEAIRYHLEDMRLLAGVSGKSKQS